MENIRDVGSNTSNNIVIGSPLRKDPLFFSIVLVSIFFSLLFSILASNKYESMNATGYDLGLFTQAFYSFWHGNLFYTNLLGESYLTEHFSPIMFLYAGLYYMHPSPVTLLWIQGFAVGLAGIPLYLLSREWLILVSGNSNYNTGSLRYIPLVLSISYLLSPMVSAPVTFDFHLMVILPLFLFFAFYFFLSKRKILHSVFLVLIISIHSSFVIIVISLLISEYLIFRSIKYYGETRKIKIFSRETLRFLLLFSLVSAIMLSYYYLISYVKPLFSGLPPSTAGPILRQAGTVSSSGFGILLEIILHPATAYSYLIFNLGLKATFLAFAAGTTGFLSFLFPELLITIVPYMLYSMFSTSSFYYTIGYQYSMMLIPMIYLAVAGAMVRLTSFDFPRIHINKAKFRKFSLTIATLLVVIGTIVGFSFSPLSPPESYHNPGSAQNLWIYKPNNAAQFTQNISKIIPSTAYILTQNDIFPFFSQIPNSYEAPWSPGLNGFNIDKFQFLVAYYASTWVYTASPSMYSLVQQALTSGQFGIYASGYQVLVLKKDYHSKPTRFVPISLNLSGSAIMAAQFGLSYNVNGSLSATNVTNGSDFFTTSKNLILPGEYQVTLAYSSSSIASTNSFEFNISSLHTNTTIKSQRILANSSALINHTSFKIINFTVSKVYNDIVFNGGKLNWNGTVSISYISVRQLTS